MAGDGAAPVYGARRDLRKAVTTHLFGLCPNNSGSTFLNRALATSRATWNLPNEGQWMPGYGGPVLGRGGLTGAIKIWASRQCWLDILTDPAAYDWERCRKAWYFQAFARDARASVFVTKAPPMLLYAGELARHFRNAKFWIMVRNPYAVCEGICRSLAGSAVARRLPLAEAAARHVVACFAHQRRNVEALGDRSIFFTYETLCAEPERVARQFHALAPALDDLVLRQRLRVGRYDETLTDMNARQIARLDDERIALFSRVFREHREVFDYFGYEIRPPAAAVENIPSHPA